MVVKNGGLDRYAVQKFPEVFFGRGILDGVWQRIQATGTLGGSLSVVFRTSLKFPHHIELLRRLSKKLFKKDADQ